LLIINEGFPVLNVLILTRYGLKGASSRMRFYQYLPWLEQSGIKYTVSELISDELLEGLYNNGKYSKFKLMLAYIARVRILLLCNKFDLVWIEKEALPWFPAWIENYLLRNAKCRMLDFDDAVFHNYDLHRSKLARFCFGHRIDNLMAKTDIVVGGNSYLAVRAKHANVTRIEQLPTVIDLNRYDLKFYELQAQVPIIVWIGSPSTLHYLDITKNALSALAKKTPFILRIIGGGFIEIPGVNVQILPWTAETESDAVRGADIGIMPLYNTPWEQGKCAYKLIQYMACGLPTIASPVGANKEVILHGETGFLASTDEDWLDAATKLLADFGLRYRLGMAGRSRVEEYYCIQKTGPKLIDIILGNN
jgi:glycosyltransferase involved in cell wall biosynthesis